MGQAGANKGEKGARCLFVSVVTLGYLQIDNGMHRETWSSVTVMLAVAAQVAGHEPGMDFRHDSVGWTTLTDTPLECVDWASRLS